MPFTFVTTFLSIGFRYYGWSRVALISSDVLLWQDAAKAIRIVFSAGNTTVAYDDSYTGRLRDAFARRVLRRIKEEARSMNCIHIWLIKNIKLESKIDIPQCSNLGPGPLILYINDIVFSKDKYKFLSYVDYMTIQVIIKGFTA